MAHRPRAAADIPLLCALTPYQQGRTGADIPLLDARLLVSPLAMHGRASPDIPPQNARQGFALSVGLYRLSSGALLEPRTLTIDPTKLRDSHAIRAGLHSYDQASSPNPNPNPNPNPTPSPSPSPSPNPSPTRNPNPYPKPQPSARRTPSSRSRGAEVATVVASTSASRRRCSRRTARTSRLP